MKRNTGYFIVILLLALYFLNPSYSKHLKKLGVITTPTIEEKSSSPGSKYKYKNYIFCSIVTGAATDQSKSFGIPGFIFS